MNHASTGLESEEARLEVFRELAELEQEIGIPIGFLRSLRDESDWSFILKLHAVIEATVTRALVSKSELPEAHGFFARLELSNASTGKLVLADAMGLVPKHGKRYARALSELRNAFVHDVRNVTIDLPSFFASLSRPKLDSYAVALCYAQHDVPFSALTKEFVRTRMTESPKEAIWSSGVFFLFVLHMHKEIESNRRKIAEQQRSAGAYLLDRLRRRPDADHGTESP